MEGKANEATAAGKYSNAGHSTQVTQSLTFCCHHLQSIMHGQQTQQHRLHMHLTHWSHVIDCRMMGHAFRIQSATVEKVCSCACNRQGSKHRRHTNLE